VSETATTSPRRADGGARIAVIGDVHLRWNEADVAYFNSSDYDFVLFVGDLAAYAHRRAIPTATAISGLRLPTLVMPGNHDAVTLAQLVAEVAENATLSDLLSAGQERRCRQLAEALAPAQLSGYSLHPLELGGERFAIVAGRPHSMGGARLSFRRHLAEQHGIGTLEESARRLCALVDESPCNDLIFLSHNGPSGFGAARDDPWGCDFRPAEGDFGDPDLQVAIDHALTSGRRVMAVIGGHMHHRLKGGGERRWSERRGETLYANPARVPRIFRRADRTYHHHLSLRLRGGRVEAREALIPGDTGEDPWFGDPL
jgi:uncharacterized protein (TIGR04168 family)